MFFKSGPAMHIHNNTGFTHALVLIQVTAGSHRYHPRPTQDSKARANTPVSAKSASRHFCFLLLGKLRALVEDPVFLGCRNLKVNYHASPTQL